MISNAINDNFYDKWKAINDTMTNIAETSGGVVFMYNPYSIIY